jgi:hypothetical protein
MLLPEASAVVVPAPSSNAYAASVPTIEPGLATVIEVVFEVPFSDAVTVAL